MSYCTPHTPNFGFLDHGCAVYGGLLLNEERLVQNPKADNKEIFIPQYNLADYWQRGYLEPHSLGFPSFLTRCVDQKGGIMLPPGFWPYSGHGIQTRNRNLLTGVAVNETTVKLWTANQRNDRRRIFEYTVQLKVDENSNDDWELLTSDDGSTPDFRSTEMPSSVLELRYGAEMNGKRYVFGRCDNGLFIVTPALNTVTSVIRVPVTAFSLIPYMGNEIIVLDGQNFLWHADLDSSFGMSRIKTSNELKLVSPSDHPRVAYAANDEDVFTVDLREGPSKSRVLLSVPDYDNVDLAAPKNRYKGCFPKPTVEHLKSLTEVPRVVLVATSRKIYLLDERMPGKPYIETSHSVVGAGDYICSAPPFKDSANVPARVFSFYMLQHMVSPDVQYFSLYDHGGAVQWSMLSPIKRLLEPIAAAQFFRQQPKYHVRITRRQETSLYGFGPTRAIHIQDGLVNDKYGHERHLLFRATDDGSLWLEAIRIVDDSMLNESALLKSAKELQARLRHLLSHSDFTGNVKRCSKKSKNCFNNIVGFYNPSRDDGLKFDNLCSPLDLLCEDTYPDPPVTEKIEDDNRLISQLVLNCCEKHAYGFRGSLGSAAPTEGILSSNGGAGDGACWCIYDSGNLSQTYVALCLLLILGDDLSRVDRQSILDGVACCQLPNGSFCAQRGSENDMRFVFTAVAVCYILNDFSTINVPQMLDYIKRSVNYDGGFGQGPGLEGHGGSTYCAVASLYMTGNLWNNAVLTRKQIERLKKWCVMKQSEGFHGRTNKPDDSCYAYWIGATLQMLDAHAFFDHSALRRFLMSVQDRFSGFSRDADSNPDILHTYFSIAGLSLIQEPFLCPLYSPLNITHRSYERLLKLHARFK